MKRSVISALVLVLAACPSSPKKPPTVIEQPTSALDSELARRQRLVAELQDEILSSYERDELPEVDTNLISPEVGPARIGVGPGDVYFGSDVRRLASSRWPLQIVPGTPTTVRSKRLRIYLSQDKQVSAAWVSDELSWRITMCNRTAVIPLRMTALYAHDGDRWVQVFEHLSFARMPSPTADGQLRGKEITEAVVDRGLSDELSRLINGLFSALSTRVELTISGGSPNREPTQPAPTYLVGVDADSEWYGDRPIESIRRWLVGGKVTLDRPRIATIGLPNKATVAYWVGNLVADLDEHPGTPASKVLLRGTFVFEKRAVKNPDGDGKVDKWFIVQGHVSQPTDDIDLAQIVYGTALISEKPLQITCDDGRKSAATPAAVPSQNPAQAAGSR